MRDTLAQITGQPVWIVQAQSHDWMLTIVPQGWAYLLGKLERAVHQAVRHSTTGKVAPVGHSTSGVMARLYLSRLSDDQLAAIRNRQSGFVFRTFNLLARTSAFENVMLPLIYTGVGRVQRREQARRALEAVGLADRMAHGPTELSGGEQQRVAIARALVNDPAIILADEPTGNLDSKSGAEVMAVLQGLNREHAITVVVVTHNAAIARHTRRIVHLHDERITGEEGVTEPLAEPFSFQS